ncbi:hypothetical protein CVT25_007380 [Psilocybe cyanescens]|uniref:Uncharacterized protein n=1 Tax=Psilocybe cyanescens TaxID=93625 RepID=A0A409XJ99_PSICY|nr:hypothetical protein CVT25_007380 [Psilocybe cyanescens]
MSGGHQVLAGFDTNNGFTVTNNTAQNIYLQTSASAFSTILPGQSSSAQTAYFNYAVRNNNTTNSAVYLSINVSSADGSVNVVSGTLRGSIGVNIAFA